METDREKAKYCKLGVVEVHVWRKVGGVRERIDCKPKEMHRADVKVHSKAVESRGVALVAR